MAVAVRGRYLSPECEPVIEDGVPGDPPEDVPREEDDAEHVGAAVVEATASDGDDAGEGGERRDDEQERAWVGEDELRQVGPEQSPGEDLQERLPADDEVDDGDGPHHLQGEEPERPDAGLLHTDAECARNKRAPISR